MSVSSMWFSPTKHCCKSYYHPGYLDTSNIMPSVNTTVDMSVSLPLCCPLNIYFWFCSAAYSIFSLFRRWAYFLSSQYFTTEKQFWNMLSGYKRPNSVSVPTLYSKTTSHCTKRCIIRLHFVHKFPCSVKLTIVKCDDDLCHVASISF